MHDIKEIRKDPAAFDAAMHKRGLQPQSVEILKDDKDCRKTVTELEQWQAELNKLTLMISGLMNEDRDGEAEKYMKEASSVKDRIYDIEGEGRYEYELFEKALSELPNIPAADVPAGADESANKELSKWGTQPDFTFEIKEHDAIGTDLNAMDFPRAAKVSGARFVILYDQLAHLERALANFMLDIHRREFGYREVQIPILVREPTLYGSGHLPKFDEDLFKTNEEQPRYLIPTAETVLTGLHANEILQEEQLPLRYVCWSNCFRAEAGAAGKDTRGLIRLHQFSKVELVSYTTPEQSKDEHERMTTCAETILQRLELPYRKMLLCAGDMGFAAEKTYDLEVWLPAQKKYREISSCSNCGAFQSRRLNARYKRQGKHKGEKGTTFPHALNGSGLAIGRTMAALLENYQQADGSVALPKVLHKYMDGEKTLELPSSSTKSTTN